MGSAYVVTPCTARIAYIEEIDARHHEGIDDGKDDVGLECHLLAKPNGSKWNDGYLVTNTVKRNGPVGTMSAKHSRPIDFVVSLRYHHNHEIPDPASWSA